MIIRRLLGFIILLTALAILVASLAGAYYVGDALSALGDSVRGNLALAQQSLITAHNTLVLSRDAFGNVNGGLGAAVQATSSAATTVAESRPLVENVSAVTTQEVPEAIEGIQNALPNIIQVANVIDRTLRTLSSIGIDRTIPLPFGGSIPLQFDLGIDYAPSTSFDATLRGFQTSLDGLPESLRGLEGDLQRTNDNLATLSADLQTASDNLSTINDRVSEVVPVIDQYIALADQLSLTLERVNSDIDRQLETLRLGAIGLLVLLALSQLAPLYLGWELLTGRRAPVDRAAAPGTVVIAPEAPAAVTVTMEPPPATSIKEEWSPVEEPETSALEPTTPEDLETR